MMFTFELRNAHIPPNSQKGASARIISSQRTSRSLLDFLMSSLRLTSIRNTMGLVYAVFGRVSRRDLACSVYLSGPCVSSSGVGRRRPACRATPSTIVGSESATCRPRTSHGSRPTHRASGAGPCRMKQQKCVEQMCYFDSTHMPHNEKVFPVRAIKTLICARASVVVAAPLSTPIQC